MIGAAVRREKSTWVVASGVPSGAVHAGVIGGGGDRVTDLSDASCRGTLLWDSIDGVVVVKFAAVVEVGFANERLGVYDGASAAGKELVAGSRGVDAGGVCSISREGTLSRDVESSERSAAQRRLASRRDARRPSESSLSEPCLRKSNSWSSLAISDEEGRLRRKLRRRLFEGLASGELALVVKPRSSVVRSRGMSPGPRGWPPSGSAMERLRFSWSAALKLLQKVAMTPQHSSNWKLAGSSQKKAARSFRACSRVRRLRRSRSSSRWTSCAT